jgi:DNA-binding CsgD family transcriptional regulator
MDAFPQRTTREQVKAVKYDVGWSRLPGMDETGQLPGMQAARLHLASHGQVIEVRRGDYTITAYRKDDLGLRNLAIIALTESGVSGSTAAGLFSLTAVQVSRIRGEYRQHGSAGLARKRGRPPALTPAQVRQARLQAGSGVIHSEIARQLGVSRPLITDLISRHGPLYPQGELPGTGQAGHDGTAQQDQRAPRAEEDQPEQDPPAAAGEEEEEEEEEDERGDGSGAPQARP